MTQIADENREKFTVVFARPETEVFATPREDALPAITGYAATFTGLSEDLGGFRTRVARRAFDAILESADVRFLVNHNPDLLLGRTRAGTLILATDDRGLSFKCHPPASAMAEHYVEEIRRGDMDGCSFTCSVAKDRWDLVDDMAVRTIELVGALYDVGPVSFPAFPDTSVSASLQASLDRARALAASGQRLGKTSARTLRLRLELYRRLYPACPIGGSHACADRR